MHESKARGAAKLEGAECRNVWTLHVAEQSVRRYNYQESPSAAEGVEYERSSDVCPSLHCFRRLALEKAHGVPHPLRRVEMAGQVAPAVGEAAYLVMMELLAKEAEWVWAIMAAVALVVAETAVAEGVGEAGVETGETTGK